MRTLQQCLHTMKDMTDDYKMYIHSSYSQTEYRFWYEGAPPVYTISAPPLF